jgi:hypothetical protein
MASEHLLTFRSGAAGFFDLCNDGGTGNFGGFRSSCTNNLVVAGGIITAPDYTRTCSCNYQNQASLALVPMPDVDLWTSFGKLDVVGPVRRLGINFGAPGDRRGDDGTLWLEYPSVGGLSPNISVKTVPAQPEQFRWHTSRVQGDGPRWVGASGYKGVTSVAVTLGGKGDGIRKYTVRLYFMEPELTAGKRTFDVLLQGREALKGLDVAKEAGGPGRRLMREFHGVDVSEVLTVTLRAQAGQPVLSAIEVQCEEKQ